MSIKVEPPQVEMMTETIVDLTSLAKAILAAKRTDQRLIVAIAGAPGSGKSTTAERLLVKLNGAGRADAVILPMDGYHYDDGLLDQMGRRARKGAPDTFDVGGLRSSLSRLVANDEVNVTVPVFDRDIEISRGSARIIPAEVGIIVVEGNYLLLNQPPWQGLHGFYDLTVMIDVSEEELRRRLTARWVGFGLTEDQITAKLEENDLPNGRLVRRQSAQCDFRLKT